MTQDKLVGIRLRISERIAEIEARITRLDCQAISSRMDSIRAMAAEHGLSALEGVADYGRHHAMMPGSIQATRACLDHMGIALNSVNNTRDREAILAALAVRLH